MSIGQKLAKWLRASADQLDPIPPGLGKVVCFSHSLYGEPKYTVGVQMHSGKCYQGAVAPMLPGQSFFNYSGVRS